MQDHYDILIIGGGLVGVSLACALGREDLRIGVIEATPPHAAQSPAFDDRAIALARGTQGIFAALQLWPALQPEATPIHRIHVSDRGRFGFAHLDRDDDGVDALGYVIPARALGAALMAHMAQLPAIDMLCPATLQAIRLGTDGAEVDLRMDDKLDTTRARLVVAADGAASAVREQLGIEVTDWAYGQTALVTNIKTQLPHRNTAYERFTDSGPLAVLPMGADRCAVVWTVRDADAPGLLALDEGTFLAALQERFGQRLGRLQTVGKRVAYPLHLLRARESVRERLALIGNAAHTLHPVAGQGFNLGLRDVAALAELIVDAVRSGKDPGAGEVLQRYADWRAADQRRVTLFTDGLARVFTNPLTPVKVLRDAGMLALDCLPPLRRAFTRITTGNAGRQPRLARGLPL